MKELLPYSNGLGHLTSIHLFVSFADQWATSTVEQQRRLRVARRKLEDLVDSSSDWAALRLGVSMIHLSSTAKAWDQADRALQHFGTDLSK